MRYIIIPLLVILYIRVWYYIIKDEDQDNLMFVFIWMLAHVIGVMLGIVYLIVTYVLPFIVKYW